MKQQGFTLIELMIVVVIIGILASFAVPSYNNYVVRASRGEGQALLQEIMRAQENYSANEFTYTQDLTELNYTANPTTGSGTYSIGASTCSTGTIAQCVQLTATGLLGQASDGNLVLNSRGERWHNGTSGWPK